MYISQNCFVFKSHSRFARVHVHNTIAGVMPIIFVIYNIKEKSYTQSIFFYNWEYKDILKKIQYSREKTKFLLD